MNIPAGAGLRQTFGEIVPWQAQITYGHNPVLGRRGLAADNAGDRGLRALGDIRREGVVK